MPDKAKEAAEAAAQAITDDMGVLRAMSYMDGQARIAAIITEKMAPAIEAGYREAWSDGVEAAEEVTGADATLYQRDEDNDWLKSAARAAIAPAAEGMEGKDE